jgi:hypothetical protein
MADWNHPSPSQGKPGDLNCEHCEGTGIVVVPDVFPERYRTCVCMHLKEIVRNVQAGWPGLIKAAKIKGDESELWPYMEKNLRVTASLGWFKAHLRWCAFRKPPPWDFMVVTDVDLMRAWLGSVALAGQEIIDPDAASVSLRHLTLLDLVEPPELLVIRLGIKTASNKEMPNVLLETLLHRTHIGKPVWVYNDWSSPFDESMRSFSYETSECLSTWPHIEKRVKSRRVRSQSAATLVQTETSPEASPDELDDTDEPEDALEPAYTEESEPDPEVSEVAQRRARRSYSAGSGQAQAVDQPKKREKPKKSNWKNGKTRGKKG